MIDYKKFPIGISDFAQVIEKKFTLIDKTMMIKDIMDDSAQAILITRPRRFGKTLNMNMLREFFSTSGKDVFSELQIARETEFCRQHQNQYPVVFITLKDCKALEFEGLFEQIKSAFRDCYESHAYLLESSALSAQKKEEFNAVLSEKNNDPDQLSKALKYLTSYLHTHTGKRVIVLIDEYDSPIHSAYTNGFYDKIINFMRTMLSSALKDNSCLEKAVMTGIARVAKESMFSGLNHLKCYTLLEKRYAQYFGFTQSEVESLISGDNERAYRENKDNQSLSSRAQRGISLSEPVITDATSTYERQILRGVAPLDDKGGTLDDKIEEIKRWYNGYKIGDYQIYNPWSIMNCLESGMEMRPYWLNTSDNALVYDLINNADFDFKNKVQNLIKGIPQEQTIEDNLTFRQMEGNDKAIWTLFFHAGYLNIASRTYDEYGKLETTIEIPNREILSLYMDIVESWFYVNGNDQVYKDFIRSLNGENPDKFFKFIQNYMTSSLSYFDLHKKTPEYVFHIFMMGLLVGFKGRYDVDSNGEAGDGRYDVMMTPKNPKDKAILIEFKVCSHEEELEQTAKDALAQIRNKKYTDGFAGDILCIGMAFCGKKMKGLYDRICR